MSGNLDTNLNKITYVADPVNSQDVVTKNIQTQRKGGLKQFLVSYGNPFPAIDNMVIGIAIG